MKITKLLNQIFFLLFIIYIVFFVDSKIVAVESIISEADEIIFNFNSQYNSGWSNNVTANGTKATVKAKSKIMLVGGVILDDILPDSGDNTVEHLNGSFRGMIMPFPASMDVPDGWLLCDGATIESTGINGRPELTDLIVFLAGSNATSATLPDLEDLFIKGAASYNSTGQNSKIQNHWHSVDSGTHSHTVTQMAVHNHDVNVSGLFHKGGNNAMDEDDAKYEEITSPYGETGLSRPTPDIELSAEFSEPTPVESPVADTGFGDFYVNANIKPVNIGVKFIIKY